ncbi:MAG: O-antigen ligase C-terminal domain-containing protein [Pseudohongiella sp.]|nr:O-antigen ligase C-terminal domain-containing protein [Pseudohongiella sp.]
MVSRNRRFFFVFAIHYYQANSGGIGLQLPSFAAAWIPLTISLGLACWQISAAGTLRYTNLSKMLSFCIVALFLPFLFGKSNVDISVDRFLAVIAIFLFFLALQQFKFSARQLLLLPLFIIIGVWVEALYGWWQFITGLISERSLTGLQTRPYGIFQQVNVMASFMATGLVLSAYMLGKDSATQTPKIVRLLYLGMPLVTVHLLHALASRAGWLGAVTGLIFVLPYVWKNADRKLLLIWCVTLTVGFSLSWLVVPATGWSASEKEIISLQSVRSLTMPQTIDMIMDKPLTGYGYGNFESSYLHYTAEKHAGDPNYPPGFPSLSHPHNELLFWATEGGIIALAGLLAAAILVWRRVYQNEIWTRLALVGLFLPIVLHTQLELPFYQSTAHLIIFVILIYWVDNLTADYKEKPLKSTLLIGMFGLLVPIVTSLFVVTTLQSGRLLTKYESGNLDNVEDLEKMTNSVVWQDRLNWTIRSKLVINGILSGQPQLGQGYIDWIPGQLAREPRVRFYQYLILAHQALGNAAEVTAVQAEADYLFPDESFEITDISSIIAKPVSVSE